MYVYTKDTTQTKLISSPFPAVDSKSPSFRQLIAYKIYWEFDGFIIYCFEPESSYIIRFHSFA